MSTDPTPAPGPTAAAATPSRRPWRRTVLAVLAVALVAAGCAFALGVFSDGGETIRVVVPAGTWDRIDTGETVELMPAVLEVEVGDTIEIVNQDDRPHTVGPYTVDAGRGLRQTFLSPGVVRGACTIGPEEGIEIVIR